MSTTDYAPTLSVRQARDRYFEENHFGADGGYGSAWVDFKLGPLPMPFPNTDARRRAVRWHDLHHVVTGYGTDILGEFEISAWELGAGCGAYVVPWQLNLGGALAGLLVAPRRTARAFARGRRSRASLYHYAPERYEPFLEHTVGELREECGVAERAEVRASDLALLGLVAVGGLLSGALSLGLLAVTAPALLLVSALRPRPAQQRA